MPHKLRSTAKGRAIYSLPIIIFLDDVSGNISKAWNKHWNAYLSNAALPREEIEKAYNVRFVTTSPFAGPMELMQGINGSIT